MSLTILLPILALLICITLGVVLITPEVKANLLIWRGRESKARHLLEMLVEQNPEKLSLYRKLARIYFLENRRDKKAIKVFELILKLKIPFEWREELYKIIAKNYNIEGRKDSEAIRVIEKAVDNELKKLKSFA